MPKRSNEFQRLVAMLTMLKSGGATVHEVTSRGVV